MLKAGIVKGESSKAAQRSGFFWFFSIVFALVIDALSYLKVQSDHVRLLTASVVDVSAEEKILEKVLISLIAVCGPALCSSLC